MTEWLLDRLGLLQQQESTLGDLRDPLPNLAFGVAD